MIFLQSDWFPANFMIDSEGRPVAIDFSEANTLPSSFATYLLWENRLGFDVKGRVTIPTTEGVDNTEALLGISGMITMGSGSFARFGHRVTGGDRETQQRIEESIKNAVDTDTDLPIWGSSK